MRMMQKLLTAAAVLLAALPASAQEDTSLEAGLRVASLRAEPASLVLEVGQRVPLTVTALDAAGNPVPAQLRIAGPRSAVRYGAGELTALAAGTYDVVATVVLPGDATQTPVTLNIPVSVSWPAISRVVVTPEPGNVYVGTTLAHSATAQHADGSPRPNAPIRWSSSNADVATVDRIGNVTGLQPGRVVITASAEGARSDVTYDVAPFPANGIHVQLSAERVRTGDVVTIETHPLKDGQLVENVPVTYSFTFLPDDSINAPGAGGLLNGNKFVGEVPGTYTILAHAGPLTGRALIDVRPREVIREVTFSGQGSVSNVHTSDLWIFEGVDGRDYGVTGTWGGDGWAFFWDVTDPANLVKVDSIQVDARTVNDVKVAPNGRYAALSREGASNRRNGVVIIDLANPRAPKVAATYDEGLTGGVHNMFPTNDYLFALSGGDKYVILDVRDIYNPTYVSEYNHPDSRIHDVWVHDGIAYSSEWGTGVVVVDVGNGKWGGTIENPKFVTNVPYPVGRTHAAFPYFQRETGKFYLFLGDEILNRNGAAWGASGLPRIPEKGGKPAATSGYYHIIDFTDPENPKDVARYEAKEFGTHNLWVEDDVLYAAYYDGGLRVVDVSGELMGNLADQGREISVFKPFDPNGYAPNAPMVWGAQPHKGHVFFSDFNSGLWSVKIQPTPRPTS